MSQITVILRIKNASISRQGWNLKFSLSSFAARLLFAATASARGFNIKKTASRITNCFTDAKNPKRRRAADILGIKTAAAERGS